MRLCLQDFLQGAPYLKMILSSAFLLALASLGLCATYGTINDVPRLNWDFIIVGGTNPSVSASFAMIETDLNEGGTAGSVLANRLTENPKLNVLLIEAGPTYVHF